LIENAEKKLLEIKDQSLNILILTMRYEIIERIVGPDDGKMYLCYKDTEDIRTLILHWQSNLPIPVRDARDFFLGTEIYYSNLHAHLDEAKFRKRGR